MIRRLAAVLFAAILLSPAPAAARSDQLSAADRSDVERAEQYLNGITTLKARFLQVAPNGGTAEGTAYLSRPGRLRLDYAPPVPIEIVANGRFLIYYDEQLEQVTYVPIDSTPAGVLVRPNVSFDGKDVRVTRVTRSPGVVNVALVQAKEPGAGEITLVFSENPFALRQWRVLDPQGQITTVSLFDVQTGVRLDPKLFDFVDPNFQPGINQN